MSLLRNRIRILRLTRQASPAVGPGRAPESEGARDETRPLGVGFLAAAGAPACIGSVVCGGGQQMSLTWVRADIRLNLAMVDERAGIARARSIASLIRYASPK